MKKTVSISLVALLMLNVMGYYGIFIGLKYNNRFHVTQRINAEDYEESETMTIKIPLSIPYFGNTGFERVEGEIRHEGQVYQLIKQKLEKDTLHVVCIRDTRATDIHEAIEDYVKTFADHSNSESIPAFIKDYFGSKFSLAVSAGGWSANLDYLIAGISLPGTYRTLPSPPPEA